MEALTLIIVLAAMLIPTIIAFCRGHQYKWIIFILNISIGWTGLGAIACFIWAIWPNQKVVEQKQAQA